MKPDSTNVTDTIFPSVTFAQQTAAEVADPAYANGRKLFVDENDRVNLRDDAGVDTPLATKAEADRIILTLECVPEATTLVVANGVRTFRAPCAMHVTAVRAYVGTAPEGETILTIDIKTGGNSIFTSALKFDDAESTTTTSAAQPVLNASYDDWTDDQLFSVDVTAVGDIVAGKGLTITVYGTRA